MKKYLHPGLFTMALILTIILFSCEKEDEGFHQISALENSVAMKINQYRNSIDSSAFVTQYIMFEEAHILSKQLANDVIQPDGTEIREKMAELTSNFGGDQSAYLTFTSQNAIADSIFAIVHDDPPSLEIVESTFTQLGVGVYTTQDNVSYVTLLFMNIP